MANPIFSRVYQRRHREAVLLHLARHGPTPQKQLGEALGIARRSLYAVLERLTQDGSIHRVPNWRDMRQHRYALAI